MAEFTGGEIANLGLNFERVGLEKLGDTHDSISEITDDMACINKFLDLAHSKTTDSNRLELNTGEELDLLDRLREIPEVAELFKGEPKWVGEENIHALFQRLGHHMERFQHQIKFSTDRLFLDEQQKQQVFMILQECIKIQQRAAQMMHRNMAPH